MLLSFVGRLWLWGCLGLFYHTFYIQAQTPNWFQVSYYPPINLLPVVYPLSLVDASSNNQLFAKQVYFPLEPVHDAVQNIPSVCQSLTANPIPTDLKGHCYSMCTQYSVPSSLVNQNLTQLFCQTYATTNIRTYQQLVASHASQPEYYYLNCTSLDANWHYQVATYDQYTLNSLGSTASVTSNFPMCLASEICFHSQGLPISPWDGPNTNIQQSDTLYYCCRTNQATTYNGAATAYSAMATYTCVATLFDPVIPSAPRAQVTCTRTIQLNSNPPGHISTASGTPQLLLQWDQSQFNCNMQCIFPYFTGHEFFQNYDPQPTHNGCSPTDFAKLCLLNVQTYTGKICTNAGEVAIGAYHYTPEQLVAKGFDSTGIYYTLGAGTPPPSLNLAYLFYARSWDPCVVGQMGCMLYCHCWNGCPSHPQCNGHGTYYDHPSIGIQKACSCDGGWSGNKCESPDGDQLCGGGARTSESLNRNYFVP